MSRAERRVVPPAPRLGSVLRLAATDLYYHGIRLVVVNLVWGIGVLMTAFSLTRSLLGIGLLVAMVPVTAGLMGMATRLVRERTLVMSDFLLGVRHRFLRVLALGAGQVTLLVITAVDLFVGLRLAGLLGTILVVTAAYTALAIWLLSVSTWPILLDPLRAQEPMRTTLRLGLMLTLAHPGRIAALGLLMALFLAVSTVLVAALITVSGAYAFLAIAHFVLPAADRLEGRATIEIES